MLTAREQNDIKLKPFRKIRESIGTLATQVMRKDKNGDARP
jgi:hypothetical protein